MYKHHSLHPPLDHHHQQSTINITQRPRRRRHARRGARKTAHRELCSLSGSPPHIAFAFASHYIYLCAVTPRERKQTASML